MTKIKFKQFLEEAVVKRWSQVALVDVAKAIDQLNVHCKDGLKAISNGGIIYRGFGVTPLDDMHFIDSSTGIRTSKDTNNIYQLMMDVSKDLQDCPSRSKSLICSTNISAAKAYHTPRVVIPYDGAQIACISESDIFLLPLKTNYGLPFGITVRSISAQFTVLLKFLNIKSDKFTESTDAGRNKLLSQFSPDLIMIGLFKMRANQFPKNENVPDDIDNAFFEISKFDGTKPCKFKDKVLNYLADNGYQNATHRYLFNLLKDNPNNRFNAISSLLMTKNNMGISLATFGEPLPEDIECWVSGKAIVISLEMWGKIIFELQKQKYPIDATVLKNAKEYFPKPKPKDFWSAKGKVKESVNNEVFKYGFRQKKNILGDKYTLIASSGWTKNSGDDSEEFKITAKDEQGVEIGWVTFKESNDKLEAFDLSILPMHRRKGIASEMYKFARKLGNDIAQSSLQTELGKKFWSQKDHSK